MRGGAMELTTAEAEAKGGRRALGNKPSSVVHQCLSPNAVAQRAECRSSRRHCGFASKFSAPRSSAPMERRSEAEKLDTRRPESSCPRGRVIMKHRTDTGRRRVSPASHVHCVWSLWGLHLSCDATAEGFTPPCFETPAAHKKPKLPLQATAAVSAAAAAAP